MKIAPPIVQPIDNKRWSLYQTYSLRVMALFIEVSVGFVFDGGSIPRFFWRLVGHPMQGKGLPAFLIHDALYRARIGDRKTADKIMHRLLRLNGVGRCKSWIIYRAVRAGGRKAWNAASDGELFYARQFVTVTRTGAEAGKDGGDEQ